MILLLIVYIIKTDTQYEQVITIKINEAEN